MQSIDLIQPVVLSDSCGSPSLLCQEVKSVKVLARRRKKRFKDATWFLSLQVSFAKCLADLPPTCVHTCAMIIASSPRRGAFAFSFSSFHEKREQMNGDAGPTVLSLDEAQVHVAQEVYEYLTESLLSLHKNDAAEARAHMNRILQAYKYAPSTTTCRVNLIQSTQTKVIEGLEREVVAWKGRHHGENSSSNDDDDIVVYPHPLLSDVVCVGAKNPSNNKSKSLASCRVPPKATTTESKNELFKTWPTARAQQGWPMTHRVIVCDRFCGEAVLRGSDIFVRGVICADANIKENEAVAVRAWQSSFCCLRMLTCRDSQHALLPVYFVMLTGVCRHSRGK